MGRAGKRSSRATLANSGLAVDGRERLSSRDSERDLLLPPSYRWGQFVVEYATVCFRSQEDFGLIVKNTPLGKSNSRCSRTTTGRVLPFPCRHIYG